MAASTTLEMFFSLDPAPRLVSKPLLFHHIPGSVGLAFRTAIGRFLGQPGAGIVEIPKTKAHLKSAGNWPDGIRSMFDGLNAFASVDAVLGNYTAFLADVTSAPIVSLVEDPDKYLFRAVAARAISLAGNINRTGSIEAALVGQNLTNPQTHAFYRVKIPDFAPESGAETKRWSALIDRIADRFTLFRADNYQAFVDHCRREYGIPDAGVPEKRKRSAPGASALVQDVKASMATRDPIWLDRMLYQRITAY